MPKLSKLLPSFSFSNFENFRELPSKDSQKYNALILTLELREFSRITLKRFSEIYCPHSHSRISRIFENYPKTLENSHIFCIIKTGLSESTKSWGAIALEPATKRA